MSDDIRAMTTELASDPASLIFLDLGEALRQRGLLGHALKVAMAGTARYPALADAHDLAARVQSDLGDGEAAFDSWMDALQQDPTHLGAHKGLGYLYFRAGDLPRALRHLQLARTRTDESGLDVAIARVEQMLASGSDDPEAVGPPANPFELDERDTDDASVPADHELFDGFEGSGDGLLLLDVRGLRLGGGLRDPEGRDVADNVAAHLAGVSREAARTARLLELGDWSSVTAECGNANLHLSPPSAGAILLARRDRSVPPGRLAVIAQRAGDAARRWIERTR